VVPQHTIPWKTVMIFMDVMCFDVGRIAQVEDRACTTTMGSV
jgi:hypothetical protein